METIDLLFYIEKVSIFLSDVVEESHNKKEISFFSTKTYVVDTLKSLLKETVLLSTQNICQN